MKKIKKILKSVTTFDITYAKYINDRGGSMVEMFVLIIGKKLFIFSIDFFKKIEYNINADFRPY